MRWLDWIKRRTPRFLTPRPQRRHPVAVFQVEELEPRVTPTGNLAITGASVVDGNNQPLAVVNVGQSVYIQADFTTLNLPSNASYRVSYTVNGLTQDTGYLNWGAGSPGTGTWDAYWGTFLATPGTNQVIVTVDPDQSVAETSYTDNTTSFTFNAVGPAAGTISYTAAQMRNAYGVNSIPNFGSAAPDGSGQTIALINGGNDPTLFADVDGFDQTMSQTTTSAQTIYQGYGAASSFLSVYNQDGVNITADIANSGSNGVPPLPASSEESWDVEWAHAMAPGAKIDEIEFDDTGNWGANLITAYAAAAKLPGVSAVNWSGGLSQWSTESADDPSVFVTPSGHVGVTFICPSNDNGANVYPSYGQGDGYYPSTSPNVVSVGGTTLTLNNDGYGSETGWSYPTPTTTVTNGSASYSQTGAWSSQGGGFSGTYSTAKSGSSSTATWTIPITSANTGWGTELSATWNASPGNASNTTYTVYDGTAATGTLLGTITLNQTKAPAGTADGGAQFQELGVFFPTLSANGTGTLTVVVSAQSANGTVVADAIGAAPAWASTGGPALFESEPAYQKAFQSTGYRTTPDVSFDADFNADGYGGGEITYGGGGTSLGGPCWDGLFAVINQGRVAEGASTLNNPSDPQQTLQALYSLPASDFHDITSGYNGFSAAPGYDLVTGRGSPIANLLIPDLVRYGVTPTITSVSPSAGSTAGGTLVTITGSNFLGATAVTFGSKAAQSFTVIGDTEITAIAPVEAAATVDVTVTTPTGTTATSSADRFTFVVSAAPRPDELGAYRASDGSWSLDSDGTPGFNPATDQVFLSFSPPGVLGVAGDWTGNGTTDIGDFRNGVWHLDLDDNGVLDPGETFQFGQAGDQPVVGDWDGNPSGRDELGVFRAAPDSVTGEFILDIADHHQMDSSNLVFTFGLATDHVVVGDWTGDGITKVGVFRDAKSFIAGDAGDAVFSLDTNNNHQFDSGDQVFVFGLVTDGIVIGDWNGSGTSKVGVYRPASAFGAPSTAVFSLDTNGQLQFNASSEVFLYGLVTDRFVTGHWAKTPPLQPEGTPQAEYAAGGMGPGGVPALTSAELQPVLQEAIANWEAAGASAAAFQDVQVQIGQLSDGLVGWTSGDQITLDDTAAGWGWYDDRSAQDAVFTSLGSDGLQAAPGSTAAGRMDLLTVVEHELGHVLGLNDVDPATHPSNLMAATLPVGTRRNV